MIKTVYAAQNKEESERMNSSSGGVFYPLAEHVIEGGGMVAGCVWGTNAEAVHILTEDKNVVKNMMGSKYVLSRIGDIYRKIKELTPNRKILFSGTPCQVASLKHYLNGDDENILYVDFFCHGIPRLVVWKKYLEYRLESDKQVTLPVELNMRSKVDGWSHYGFYFKFSYENGKVYSLPQKDDLYMKAYTSDIALLDSCYQCKYKGCQRTSDITMGDYWGIWNEIPHMDDNTGTSAVVINTPKGAAAFEQVKKQFKLEKTDIETVNKYNLGAHMCPDKKLKRLGLIFLTELETHNFAEAYGKVRFQIMLYKIMKKLRQKK